MAIDNSYTQADINEILNSPGIFYFRQYGSSDSYTRAVFTNGANFSYTPTIGTQAFDDTGDVYDYVGQETGAITFSYGKPFDIDFMSKLSNGLFQQVNITAGAQAVVDQTIAAGWTNKQLITLELVDADGVYYKADGVPAITSVTASTAGVLADNDDYIIVPDPNSKSGYSISLNTAGTALVGTDESVVIVYNSPTVVSQSKMTGGGVSNYDAVEGYFDTVLKDDTPAKVRFYRGYYNGNMNLTFGTENEPAAALTDVSISLKKDTTRAQGDQIFAVEIG